eukprot:gb/GFBE01064456.1/.p1 GENE.gb/GFBE01064456.1/~~gb/GFBE01064456.1/.p1  ORF type:complete len:126 (+),score=9.54 gb/GFBE01064456.1/:1-378(+)
MPPCEVADVFVVDCVQRLDFIGRGFAVHGTVLPHHDVVNVGACGSINFAAEGHGHGICSQWHAITCCRRCHLEAGGRGSTASQRTDGELAPENAAGKVPVPMGRECQRETARSRPWFLQRCFGQS